MAHVILTDCLIKIDDVEYTEGTSAAISMSADAVDITPFGHETRRHFGGILDWSMAFNFVQDEAVTGQSFFDMLGTLVEVEVRPTSAVVSAENPAYVGTALVTEYSPLDGSVGEAQKVALSLVSNSPLQRLTAEPVA
jgi:hypothetical protein